MTLAELLLEGKTRLSKAGILEADTDAWYLLSFVTDMTRAGYLLCSNEELTEEDWAEQYRRLIGKRASHVPLQHLTGSQEFMGYSFFVTPDVLIPRQDTETLVEEAAGMLSDCHREYNNIQVLDLCTGSGCIGISLKLMFPKLQVTASDKSEEALAVAEKNARDLSADVKFLHSDLFQDLEGSYDMIVSNPPYISTEVVKTLMPEVRDYEPASALDGGSDGLDFYRQIAFEAPVYLKDGGILLLEIGYDQKQDVWKLLEEAGFQQIRCKKDLAGLDRVVTGIYYKTKHY